MKISTGPITLKKSTCDTINFRKMKESMVYASGHAQQKEGGTPHVHNCGSLSGEGVGTWEQG